jgi:deoxycytidine triphosphate deaminase
MLSSDLIAFYHDAVGGMIGPWDDGLLKPAAYELTLGPNCLVNGRIRVLSDDDPWLEIPYNSIVFVSMGQWVRLPHYIAARFDLAIEFIYQGILLGTGPQVDPGFQGVLSCPLHNISSDSVHLRLGQPFAKMDFAKTSGLWRAQDSSVLQPIADEDALYAAEFADKLPGRGDKVVRLFKKNKRWREPIFSPDYAGQKLVQSSVKHIELDVAKSRVEIDEFGDDVRRIRRFGIAAAVGVLLAITSLLLALAQLDRDYTDSQVDRAAEEFRTDAAVQDAANERLRDLERELSQLRVQLAELRGRVTQTARNP